MKFDFDKCVHRVLLAEGGFVNNKADRGGATNYGITRKTLSEFRGNDVSIEDVSSLTQDEAIEIYRKNYWVAAGLDLVKDDVRVLLLFDQCVNCGVDATIKRAQMMLCSFGVGLKVDGILGPVSALEINHCDYNLFCRKFLQISMNHYIRLCTADNSQIVFLRGWMSRLNTLWDECWV